MAEEGLVEIEGMEEDSETTGRGTTSGRWTGSQEAGIEMPGTGSRRGLEDCVVWVGYIIAHCARCIL